MSRFEEVLAKARLACEHPEGTGVVACNKCFAGYVADVFTAGELSIVDAMERLMDTGHIARAAELVVALAPAAADKAALLAGFMAGAVSIIEAVKATAERPLNPPAVGPAVEGVPGG